MCGIAGICGVSDKTLLERIFDIKYWLHDALLMKADKMAMATSLEARVPFLDPKLLQLAYNVPSARNLKKRLLKISAKDILPNDVMQRKKHGFNAPVKEWFNSDTRGTHLSDEMIKNTPYMDVGNIQEIWDLHRKGNGDYGILLWKCLCYVTWYDQSLIKRLIVGA